MSFESLEFPVSQIVERISQNQRIDFGEQTTPAWEVSAIIYVMHVV
jgi:hypothetical protein